MMRKNKCVLNLTGYTNFNHIGTHRPSSFSLVFPYTFHLWLLIDRWWKVETDLHNRDEKAGCRGRVPGPPGLASSSTLHSRPRGPGQGPGDADQKPALSVRPTHVNAKSQIVLWHVFVVSVSGKHTHTNVFWQGLRKFTCGTAVCLCSSFAWDTWAERQSHS